VFDTVTKYNGTARFSVPATLGSGSKSAVRQAALTMFDALGCAGVARVDSSSSPTMGRYLTR